MCSFSFVMLQPRCVQFVSQDWTNVPGCHLSVVLHVLMKERGPNPGVLQGLILPRESWCWVRYFVLLRLVLLSVKQYCNCLPAFLAVQFRWINQFLDRCVRDKYNLGRVLAICAFWISILNSLIKIQKSRKAEGFFLPSTERYQLPASNFIFFCPVGCLSSAPGSACAPNAWQQRPDVSPGTLLSSRNSRNSALSPCSPWAELHHAAAGLACLQLPAQSNAERRLGGN